MATHSAPAQIVTLGCKPIDPRPLRETHGKRVEEAARIQESFVASWERRALIWMAERTPKWISPDHLTGLGLAAQLCAGASYALASRQRLWLLAAIFFLALNWLGDSLDGTLARVRRRLRPQYGFYVDHMVDSLGAVALMGGLGLSGYMHPAIAVSLLICFLLLSIQSYLATHTLGEFRLSYWNFGPTELRILLALGNLALLWKPAVRLFGETFLLFDVGGLIGAAGMTVMVFFFTLRNTLRLYRAETSSSDV